MMKHTLQLALVTLLTVCSACTTVLDVTRERPIELHPGKRTIGTVVDDQQLETIARVNLRKASPELKHSHISVVSFNGIVLLVGQTYSSALRTLAGDTVKEIHSVRQVFNEIQVQGKISMLARTNDSWLTTKAKSVMMARKDIDASRIKVVTESGVVYLLGLLTQAEAARAAKVVSGIGGVQKVVKAVEYLD